MDWEGKRARTAGLPPEIITWYPDNVLELPPAPKKSPMSGTAACALRRISDILSCFELFVTPEVLEMTVQCTDLEGQRKAGSRAGERPTCRK